MTSTFTVDRSDLRRSHWLKAPSTELAQGQARLRIDRFALTSNNITYGSFGDTMSYWSFFPTGDAATGCIPAWGFATVAESRAGGVEAGERFYGYYPIADEVVLEPVRSDPAGFVDGAAHRRELHGVYNRYLRCSHDPLYDSGREALLALLRPLFVTSFLIDDFLADSRFFEATQVLISSASSKTGYGLAFCLAARRGQAGAPVVVGLTSARNLEFTRSLGCYDSVVDYAELGTLDASRAAVYVDMSGDSGLRASIHRQWNERLAYSCSVGGTHWQELGSAGGLPGPRPALFFAPDQAKKRGVEWGPAALQERIAAAWSAFVGRVADPRQPWLRVVEGHGRQAVSDVYAALLDGRVAAQEGHVLSV